MSNSADESYQSYIAPLRTLSGHTGPIYAMAFFPDSQRLVIGSFDKTSQMWRVGDGGKEGKAMVHAAFVQCLAVSSDGKKIISGDESGRVTVWDAETQELLELWQHPEKLPELAISADDQLVAYGRWTVIIRELNSGRIKHEIKETFVLSLSFSSDGSRLACGRWKDVEIYDVDSGRLIHRLVGHDGWVRSLQWSLDCTKIYSGSDDSTIRCWDTRIGKQIGQPWAGHTDFVYSLSLSPNGSKLASGSLDKTVRFWDTSGHPVGYRLQLEHGVYTVCISPSNKIVAVSGFEGKVSIWPFSWSDENQAFHADGSSLSVHSSTQSIERTPPSYSRGSVQPSQPTIHSALVSQARHMLLRAFGSPFKQTGSQVSIKLPDPDETARRPASNDHREAPAAESLNTSSVEMSQTSEPHAIAHRHPSIFPSNRLAETHTVPSRQADDSQSSSLPLDLTSHIVKLDDRYLQGGSFGDVFRCRYNSPTGAVEVAVKSFRFHFTLEEGNDVSHAVKMVRRELGIWRRLDHPNIVPFLGTATGIGMQGSLALVSMWMPNGSLHMFLQKYGEQLHVAHQLQLLRDIANGLDYLHSFSENPIVHGDVNGNNVLVDGNFNARLVDFGYSAVIGNVSDALTYLKMSTARPGTIRWAAPELIPTGDGTKVCERTIKNDIYSFGCLGLQVLSGKQPWSEIDNEVTIILRLSRGQNPKRPASRAIDDRHWELIQRCWTSPKERPTAAVLASDIKDLLSACPPSPSLCDFLQVSSS